MEKATLKDLIAKKLQKDNEKTKSYEINVKSMGKSLTFKKPSDEMRLDMLDEMGTEPDIRTMMSAYKKIIYLSCDLLQNQELQEELGVVDPFDTVDSIFDLDDILEIGEQLMDAMDSPVDKVKNL